MNESIPTVTNPEQYEQRIQQSLDSFYEFGFVNYDEIQRNKAFDQLTYALAQKEGFNEDSIDVNSTFTQNKQIAELEVIKLDVDNGAYQLKLVIRNKFADSGEVEPKKWEYNYDLKVSPEFVENYKKSWE